MVTGRPEGSSESERRQCLRTMGMSVWLRKNGQSSDLTGKWDWLLQGIVVLGEFGLRNEGGKEALRRY